VSFDDYAADDKTVYAVTRALEIIPEASRRIPDDIKTRHPDIDWQGMAAKIHRFISLVCRAATTS